MFTRLFLKIYLKIEWLFRVFLNTLGLKRKYLIDDISISIDYVHRLPDYQRDHPKYDKFLPFFVKYLPNNSIVVDVGSNVGDTVVGMCQKNPNLEYFCIEADKKYFNDLLINVNNLKKIYPKVIIHTLNKFIGKNMNNVSLKKGTEGTNTSVKGGNIKSFTLSNVMKKFENNKTISLLKTDVDGYDYDVIKSSYSRLSKETFLFFECYYENISQYKNFKSFFRELYQKKYNNFAVFDNFGQFICITDNLNQINELLSYVLNQNLGKGTRTFFYYDVLAFNNLARRKIVKILEDYNR